MKRLLSIVLLVISARATAQTPFNAPEQKQEFQEVEVSSRYVPMRDGVRIAVDLLVPKGLREGQRIPALFKIARFGRAPMDGSISEEDRFWVQHGFARVLIDERGTGASFGTSRYGVDTIPDLYDIADWVAKQSWSNGRIGAIGVSIEGTAAELLAAPNHPAVRAVAPWFSDYNYYTDLVRPGGMFNEWLLRSFEDFTLEMDSGESTKRVAGDVDGTLLKKAIAEHRNNLDIYSAIKGAKFIDDPLAGSSKSLLEISIPGVAEALHKSRVPMLILASWYDAGTVQGTLRRFQEFSNPQTVFIGAWSHGANSNADPFLPSGELRPSREQQWMEALQFFDHYLKGESKDATPERRVSYYVIGKNEWRSTETWPPAGLQKESYQLNEDGSLGTGSAGGKLTVVLQAASSGEHSRWRTQLGGGPVDYSGVVKQMSRLTPFTTAPLAANLEIAGQPVLKLRLSYSVEDPSVIAYLLAIDPSGNVFYLTEGHLRLLHRKLAPGEQTLHSFIRRDAEPVRRDEEMAADLTMLPTAVFLQKGSRLRVVLASGDDATFGKSGTYEATISAASRLELTVRH